MASLLHRLRPQRRAVLQQLLQPLQQRRWQHGDAGSRDVPLTHPAVCVWGANTGVGKTLVSAGLVAAAVRNQVRLRAARSWLALAAAAARPVATEPAPAPIGQLHCADCNACMWAPCAPCCHSRQVHVAYIKPVQTGFPADSDARVVVRWPRAATPASSSSSSRLHS